MLNPQNSLGERLIFVISFWKFEFVVFAPKAPIFTFGLYYPLGMTINVIASLSLLIGFLMMSPKDIFMLYVYA